MKDKKKKRLSNTKQAKPDYMATHKLELFNHSLLITYWL